MASKPCAYTKSRKRFPEECYLCEYMLSVVLLLTSLSTVTSAAGCTVDICKRSELGLHCRDKNVIFIDHVSCNLADGSSCVVARTNLLTLCTGQQTCATRGLRKILRLCRGRRKRFSHHIVVSYVCVKKKNVINSCNSTKPSPIEVQQGLIVSPNFFGSAVKYNHCVWTFDVPKWRVAGIVVTYLSSRQSEGACENPILTIKYNLCHGRGFKSNSHCMDVNRPAKSRACGRIYFTAQDFSNHVNAKFLVMFKVDHPRNVQRNKPFILQSEKCGGFENVGQMTPASTQVFQNSTTNNHGTLVTTKPKRPTNKTIHHRLWVAVILAMAGTASLLLVVGLTVICCKAARRGEYHITKTPSIAKAQHVNTSESDEFTSRDILQSRRPNRQHERTSTIPEETRPFSSSPSTHSENFVKYFIEPNHYRHVLTENPDTSTWLEITNPPGHTNRDMRRPIPYPTQEHRTSFSFNEFIPNVPCRTTDNVSSFGEIVAITPNKTYESLTNLNDTEKKRSSYLEYDNVTSTDHLTDENNRINEIHVNFLDLETPLLNAAVPHYFINGDTYALVQKSPATLRRSRASHCDTNRKNKLKQSLSQEPAYHTSRKYVEKPDEFY